MAYTYMRTQGFTIVEALVAISLFFIIVSLLSLSFSQSLTNLSIVRRHIKPLHEISKILWLQKSFASVIDYYVKDEDWYPLFVGERDFLSYVSEWALSGDLPVIVCLVVEKDRQGRKKLVYYEKEVLSLRGEDLENFFRKEEFRRGRKWPLFDDLDDILFEYYGQSKGKISLNWHSRFLGKREQVLPTLVKITMIREKTKKELLFQIMNTSNLKNIYKEIY